MSDNALPPVTPPSDGPPPVPKDGLDELGLAGPPPVPVSAPAPYDAATTPYADTALRIANPGWRALAFAIDGFGTFVITTLIVFVGLAIGGYSIFFAVPSVPALSALLSTILTATLGVTPGKAMVRIRVVHAVTGAPIGAWAILRSLVIVSPIVLAFVVSWALSSLAYRSFDAVGPSDLFSSLAAMAYYLPFIGWLAMLVVIILRPRHRGLEDLVARSIVVRR